MSWHLTWSDEFAGTALNSSWSVRTNQSHCCGPFGGPGELQLYLPDEVSVHDGLLDIRFAASRDGRTARYVPAANGRSSWIPLGINRCQQMTPGSDPAGLQWCDRTPQLATTSHDQSAMYLLRQTLLLIPSPFRLTDFFDGAGI